jgi:hypothetical protein
MVVEVEEDCLRASSSVSSCFILACKNFGVGKTLKFLFSVFVYSMRWLLLKCTLVSYIVVVLSDLSLSSQLAPLFPINR